LKSARFLAILFATALSAIGQTQIAVPTCPQLAKGERSIGWGKCGLQFHVPKKEIKVLGGKPDVDYVEYIIRPKNGKNVLHLYFGGMAFGGGSYPEDVQGSSQLSKNRIVDSAGSEAGQDDAGAKITGKWRYFRFRSEGAYYKNASPMDSGLFDRIIATACSIPYPPDKKK
jgi:hypothetical protein